MIQPFAHQSEGPYMNSRIETVEELTTFVESKARIIDSMRRRNGLSEEDAEDQLQEALSEIAAGARRRQPHGREYLIKPWTRTAVMARIEARMIDLVRKKARRPQTVPHDPDLHDDLAAHHDRHFSNDDYEHVTEEEADLFWRCVSALPAIYREAILDEANRTAQADATHRTRLMRARKMLRECIAMRQKGENEGGNP